MGAIGIVPVEHEAHFPPELLAAKRHEREVQSQRVPHRADESLDDGDRAVLPNGPEARSNAVAPTPSLEAVIPELGAFVAAVTRNALAVCSSDHPLAALSSKIAMRSVGGY
jgi:hypothetical protein